MMMLMGIMGMEKWVIQVHVYVHVHVHHCSATATTLLSQSIAEGSVCYETVPSALKYIYHKKPTTKQQQPMLPSYI